MFIVVEAFELVWLFMNKTVVSEGLRRRGNPGYPQLQAVRLLGYAKLRGIETDKGLEGGGNADN